MYFRKSFLFLLWTISWQDFCTITEQWDPAAAYLIFGGLGCWRVLLRCWGGRSLIDRMSNFRNFVCGHPKLHIISLDCGGARQCTSTSCVLIHCMVLEIQLFLFHAFQKVVAPCFCELCPHKSENSCTSPTYKNMQGLYCYNVEDLTFQ